MKSSALFMLSSLVAISPAVYAQSQPNNANCTVFNWDGELPYLINGTTQRISGAATCPSKSNQTHDCPITAKGEIQVSFSYNISSELENSDWNTANHSTDNFLRKLIWQATNASFNGQGWNDFDDGVIDTTEALRPGQSGYINFTPLLRCVAGTMSNCTGGLQDGIGIQACAAVYHVEGGSSSSTAREVLDGTSTIEDIPQSDVGKYPDPFSNQLSSGAGRTIAWGGSALLSALAVSLTAVLA